MILELPCRPAQEDEMFGKHSRRVSDEVVETWMRQVVAGEDNEKTHFFIEEAGYSWTVWSLAQAANAHFDFTSGDAEPPELHLARKVLGPDAPEGAPDEE